MLAISQMDRADLGQGYDHPTAQNEAMRSESMAKIDVRTALAELIFKANPYTKGRAPMHFVAPTQRDPKNELMRDSKKELMADDVDVEQIPVEEDDKYSADWMFKGQPQKINKAIRITYRYEKRDKNGSGLGYLVTDYLLVGFEGSAGGE
jgi:hypothetical protein